MTLEELRERLLQKGHTKQELRSKVLASALDIFNNSNGEVLDFIRLENEKKELGISPQLFFLSKKVPHNRRDLNLALGIAQLTEQSR